MKRLLLCEKNTLLRNALLRIIQRRFPHIDIKWVLSGEECLAGAKDFRPDLLILGAGLYGEKSLDLLEQIRASHPAVTIIVFIDYDIDEYRKDAILRGADHVIARELWTGNEIVSSIHTILAQ
jgi:DNA-binding NarL/FixJ family response regulator